MNDEKIACENKIIKSTTCEICQLCKNEQCLKATYLILTSDS